jgi:flagellar biosynthesis chaperone FliJ
MGELTKNKKKGLNSENLGHLQDFIHKLKNGEISPFKEKTERARQNLKNAGLIK